MIEKAMEFAHNAHKGHFRKGGGNLPYIIHPINVMNRVRSYGVVNNNMLVAAILHDTIEDTPITEDDVRCVFGDEVCGLVLELTKPYTNGSAKEKCEWLRDLGANASSEAIVVKYADRMSNIDDFILENDKNWRNYAKVASPIYERVFDDSGVVEIAPNIIEIAHRELSTKKLLG